MRHAAGLMKPSEAIVGLGIPGPKRARIWLLIIVGVGLVLRLAHWWAVREMPFFSQLAMDSQEYDRWAMRLAGGDWWGGDAFFQAPLYPYLLALVYVLFGHSYDAVYLLQIGLGSLGIYAVYRAGVEVEDELLGLIAAAFLAVAGVLIFHDVQVIKTSLSVTASAALIWAVLVARRRGLVGHWLLAGLVLGLLVELRENSILLLPLLVCLTGGRGLRRALARASLLVAGVLVVLAPVAVRNLAVSGELLPTTYQGGVNFYIGNNPLADGTYRPLVEGRQIPAFERREPTRIAESELGRSLTPGEVSRFWLDRGLAWAWREPAAFVALQIRKVGLFTSFYEWPDAVDYYWVRGQSKALRLAVVELGSLGLLAAWGGLLLVHRRQEIASRGELARWNPVLLFIAGWTASTVVFFVFSRYRLGIAPALAMLAALPIHRLLVRTSNRQLGRVDGLAAAVILCLLVVPHLLGYGPRLDLVHYNLGRLADERGDTTTAANHYRLALVANSEDFLSVMNLGNHAARSGRYPEAVKLYARAAQIAPASVDVLSNLGGAYLAVGRVEDASQVLGRALELDGSSPSALSNGIGVALAQADIASAKRLLLRLEQAAPEEPVTARLRQRVHRAMDTASATDRANNGRHPK